MNAFEAGIADGMEKAALEKSALPTLADRQQEWARKVVHGKDPIGKKTMGDALKDYVKHWKKSKPSKDAPWTKKLHHIVVGPKMPHRG